MQDENKSKGCGFGGHHHFWLMKVLWLVVIVAIIFALFGNHHGGKNADQNTIVVSGMGEVFAKPDMATVSFSVTSENLDVSKASDAVNTKIAAIVAKLEADGVAATDIQTADYSINPQYNYVNSATQINGIYIPSGTQTLAGYDVTQNINLNIKDLTKAGTIITDLTSLGVTNMSGLTFTNSKETDLTKQARDAAIADARSQAQDLAKALGVKLGDIVAYSDGGSPIYYAKAMTAAVPSASGSVTAVLPTGENDITSNVSITYAIK